MNIHQPSSMSEGKSPKMGNDGRIESPEKFRCVQMDLKHPAEELDGETRLDIKRGMFHILNFRDKSAEDVINNRRLRISAYLLSPVKEFCELIWRLGLDREPCPQTGQRRTGDTPSYSKVYTTAMRELLSSGKGMAQEGPGRC